MTSETAPVPGELIVIAGAGGFIGGHLVARLRADGHTRIRGVDIKPFDEWYQRFDGVENVRLDLQAREAWEQAGAGGFWGFKLAGEKGGRGFLETLQTAGEVGWGNNNQIRVAGSDPGG